MKKLCSDVPSGPPYVRRFKCCKSNIVRQGHKCYEFPKRMCQTEILSEFLCFEESNQSIIHNLFKDLW